MWSEGWFDKMGSKIKTKICAKCRKEKEVAYIHNVYCRTCTSESNKENYRVNKKRISDVRIKRVYGIDLKTRQFMLESQKYICPICEQPLILDKACIDHDHNTGRVRGLLHGNCNFLVGMFENSRYKIDNIHHYLEDGDQQ